MYAVYAVLLYTSYYMVCTWYDMVCTCYYNVHVTVWYVCVHYNTHAYHWDGNEIPCSPEYTLVR